MKAFCGLAAGVALGLAAPPASAAEPREGGFWWGSADVGAASVRRTYSVTSKTRDTTFALALSAGYAWDPRLLLGVELGGWTLESSDLWNPARGEGIQTFYAVARYYPLPASGLFVKAGYGNLSYWNKRVLESGAHGHGGVLGLGTDLRWSGSWHATPSIEYAWGEYDGATSPPGVVQDQRYRALTVRIGVTYR